MIETVRLVMSAWTEADRDDYLAMTADPEVMADYGGPFGREVAEARFERQRAAFARDGFGKWTLRRRSDGAYLGYCGVNPIHADLPPAPGLEIGWRMMRAAWGRGYATEAATAALADIFARTDASEVIAFTAPTNTRSLAVMSRLGLARDPSRDFFYQPGWPAVVWVAPRAAWSAKETR
jgi:RimJ/RimL family protein N-acetyltransferase